MDSLINGAWRPGRSATDAEVERAELEQHAADVLRQWLPGYTDPFTDGEQRRVVALDHTDDGVVVLVRRAGIDPDPTEGRRYAVTVTVTGVTA